MTSKKTAIITGIVIFFLVIVLYFAGWFLIYTFVAETNRGIFGDQFGAVNALFSGLAFAGIIITILLQKKELKLQRKELKSTRKVFEKQNKMISQEKFENTFFKLLDLYNSIVNSVRYQDTNGQQKQGRACFERFRNHHEVILFRANPEPPYEQPEIDKNVSIEKAVKAYGEIYDSHKSELSHYFRTLYHIIKFIDNSNVEDKKQYISIVRAQLSSYEQVMLFYNCLHENGKDKFKPLIEEYTLFKNIDDSLLFNQNHRKKYANSAFVVINSTLQRDVHKSF